MSSGDYLKMEDEENEQLTSKVALKEKEIDKEKLYTQREMLNYFFDNPETKNTFVIAIDYHGKRVEKAVECDFYDTIGIEDGHICYTWNGNEPSIYVNKDCKLRYKLVVSK